MNNFLTNIDFWNFLIALIALAVSIYSVVYTRKQNAVKIDVVDAYTDRYDDYNLPFVKFSIFNNSPKAVKITDLKLYDPINQEISYVPDYTTKYKTYSPFNIPDAYYESDVYESPIIIPANSSIKFTYYVLETYSEIIIKITSDEKMSFCSKSKSFHVQLMQPN